MKIIFAIAFVVYSVEGLDCGIHINKNDALKATINKCLISNKTLEDLWDMAPMSSESDSSSEEVPPVDGKMLQNFRIKRASVRLTNTEATNETTPEPKTVSTESQATENCIIQCIFDNLQMTDLTGYPVHAKILDGLLKNTTNRELRDFLQDTTDECFQQMDKEDTMDPCSYSNKLVTCLAEKGRSNCADWPVGDLPFKP
ncbi:general odorant-binding protein 71 [Tribolium madens]|uniref:general odorant-binding protein 71 n=1 Tax=Tribolium madens TaxID=41895 RepID=UPI001CF75D13|nr:general odorant-binding protein 71 [Tribolium madens]